MNQHEGVPIALNREGYAFCCHEGANPDQRIFTSAKKQEINSRIIPTATLITEKCVWIVQHINTPNIHLTTKATNFHDMKGQATKRPVSTAMTSSHDMRS